MSQSQNELLIAVLEVIIPALKAGVLPGLLATETSGSDNHFLFVLQGDVILQTVPPSNLAEGACCIVASRNEASLINRCITRNKFHRSRALYIRPVTGGAFCQIVVFRHGEPSCPLNLYLPDTQLSYLMQQVREELTLRELDFEALASTYIQAFFLRLHRALMQTAAIETQVSSAMALGNSTQPPGANTDCDEVRRARNHIEGNLQGHMTLDSIAAHVHTSPSHLNRLFNLSLGTSVMKYVTSRRIEAAKSLLIQTDLAVHVVGQLTGYPQHAHFTQTFTQHVKLAPQEYRKRYKIEHRGL